MYVLRLLAVYYNGDLSVYKHDNNADGNASMKENIDKRHEKSTSAGGEKMRKTKFWDDGIDFIHSSAEIKIFRLQPEFRI
ncbi:hypothetical protein [Pedobacter sp. L105]|uniref:hypothetical protein n=1 Tax=Pedobacter sp. L105 TaxID=1641871 RepID=UPI00131E35DD|nr:hypothetical protein [Pedobacter sp. L105]